MICLAESVMMFLGRDMMIFNDTTFKREDYDMKRLSKAEGLLFLIDGAFCPALWRKASRNAAKTKQGTKNGNSSRE